MGSFTKIYYCIRNPNKSLVLTWDIGYKNVTLLDGDRVVHNWDSPVVFEKGTFIHDERLGQIKLNFTERRPLMLELRVEGKRFAPRGVKGQAEFRLQGPKTIFWIMFTSTLLYTVYIAYQYPDILSWEPHILDRFFVIFSIIAAIYLFTAIMLTLKKYWTFFIGFGYFTLSTFLFVYDAFSGSNVWWILLTLARLAILVYLIFQIKTVILAMKAKRNSDYKESTVLDDEF